MGFANKCDVCGELYELSNIYALIAPKRSQSSLKQKERALNDVVNHPEHYISESGIETIDVIEAFTKDVKDPFEAYCTGNIIKYICRWPNKNGVEDLKKARWYLDKLIEHVEDPCLKAIDELFITSRTDNTDHNEEA